MKTRSLLLLLMLIMITSLCFAQEAEKKEDKELKKKIKATKDLIKNLEQPLNEYASNHPYGKYPDAGDEEDGKGTSTLVEKLKDGNYYKFDADDLSTDEPYQLVDAWGKPMHYTPWKGKKCKECAHNKKSYDLWSAGPDGKFDTNDDITNWAIVLKNEVKEPEQKPKEPKIKPKNDDE